MGVKSYRRVTKLPFPKTERKCIRGRCMCIHTSRIYLRSSATSRFISVTINAKRIVAAGSLNRGEAIRVNLYPVHDNMFHSNDKMDFYASVSGVKLYPVIAA